MNTQWVGEEQTIWGVPGIWAPRPRASRACCSTATAADGVTVDGQLVDGTVVVRGTDAQQPSEVVVRRPHDRHGHHAARTGNTRCASGTRSPRRSRTSAASARSRSTQSWIVTGTFTPNPEGTTLGFQHLKDEGESREQGDPRRHHLRARRHRVHGRRLQGRPRAAARLLRRDERRLDLQRRPVPLHRAEPRWHDHAELQHGRPAAVRVQLQLQLPHAARSRTASRSGSKRARRTSSRRTARCSTEHKGLDTGAGRPTRPANRSDPRWSSRPARAVSRPSGERPRYGRGAPYSTSESSRSRWSSRPARAVSRPLGEWPRYGRGAPYSTSDFDRILVGRVGPPGPYRGPRGEWPRYGRGAPYSTSVRSDPRWSSRPARAVSRPLKRTASSQHPPKWEPLRRMPGGGRVAGGPPGGRARARPIRRPIGCRRASAAPPRPALSRRHPRTARIRWPDRPR